MVEKLSSGSKENPKDDFSYPSSVFSSGTINYTEIFWGVTSARWRARRPQLMPPTQEANKNNKQHKLKKTPQGKYWATRKQQKALQSSKINQG